MSVNILFNGCDFLMIIIKKFYLYFLTLIFVSFDQVESSIRYAVGASDAARGRCGAAGS